MYTSKILKSFLSLAIFLIPVLGFSQSNYKPGFIVNLKGDTIPGLIDLREWEQTPQSINFKKDKTLKAETLGVEELNSFTITNNCAFEKYSVNVSLGTVKLADLPTENDTTSETRTIFLQLLEKGKKLSLYIYTDKLKDRFYIKETNSTTSPKELQYTPYLENGRIHGASMFANQLFLLIVNNGLESPKLNTQLESLKYNESDILKVIRTINGDQSKSKTKNKSLKPRFFASAFLSSGSLVYKGDHDLAKDAATHKSTVLPGISFGVDAFKNKEVQKVVFRVEGETSLHSATTSLVSNYYNTFSTYRTTTHELKYLSLTFNPQITYNFYNRPLFKTFVSGGVSLSRNWYLTNNYTDAYNSTTSHKEINLHKVTMSYSARAGIQLKRRIEFYVKYNPTMKLDYYVDYSIYNMQKSLGVTYLFK